MKIIKLQLTAGLIAAAAFTASALNGQDPGEEDLIILDEAQAEDIPIEESILATTRPISSVYGTDRSILDTPRNVNIVSREQLDAISIKDVRDFSKLTSSSYTKTNFGAPTTPNLRGQEADLLINGVRRGHSINGNGVPINFNSVESVNIVKGPAGAVFGTSNYVGGYADLITKRAYFDNGGSVEYTYGTFDQHTLDFDANIALSDTMAFRTSVQLKEWDGFWDRWYDKSQSVYATFVYRPNEKYRFDIMGEYYKGNYTENWGINRPTQDLIDDGLYIPNVGSDADYNANYTANPPVGFGNFGSIELDLNNPVSVRREGKLSAPGDDSNAEVFWLQGIHEYVVSDTLKFTNNTYFHYKDRETFSSYHYSEYMPDNWSAENRFQVIQDFDDKIELTYGFRLKYQEIESVNHFFNEPVNYYDMTRDPNLFRVPDSSFEGFIYDRDPRGVLDYWYVGGFSADGLEAFDTESFIYSPFFQADIEVNDKFSILLGATIDYLEHKEGIPSAVKALDKNGTSGIYDGTNFIPGNKDDDTITDLDYSKDDSSANFYNYNISFVYKPTEDSSVYFTYNEGEHYDNNTGGAINQDALEGLETELIELGSNISLFDGKAYIGAALFHQEYTTRNQDGTIDTVETDGFEIEFNYQPNRNFFATIGYSFLDSERTAGFFATSYTAADAGDTGGFFITPTFPAIAPGQTFENPGVPPHLLNALVQYQFDNGIGLQANLVYTSSMEVGYDGAIIDGGGDAAGNTVVRSPKLDAQFEIDAKIFYEWENWRFEASVFNLTDEENWDLPNTGYANGSIVARPERSYEFSVRYSW
ncbi:MAG: TonB-dependent receptor plug domain-containing protein [Verrucomicrobiota bacterium]